MIIRTHATARKAAKAHWRRRWAAYVVKAERRMPAAWVRRLRLGQPAWDPKTQRPLYRWGLLRAGADGAGLARMRGAARQRTLHTPAQGLDWRPLTASCPHPARTPCPHTLHPPPPRPRLPPPTATCLR
jgi:hypothetical protein